MNLSNMFIRGIDTNCVTETQIFDREKFKNSDLKNIFGHFKCAKYQTEEELQRSMHEMLA